MINLLFGNAQNGRIGVINLDAVLTEQHSRTSTISSHPVEGGAQVTDHIISEPAEVTIDGIVTNTPIYILASLTAPSPIEGSPSPVEDRVGAAYDEIKRIHQQSELIEIVTALETYSDMAINSLTITRDVTTGNVLSLSITAREVTLVTTQSLGATSIPDPVTAANIPTESLGKVPTIVANPATALKVVTVVAGAIVAGTALQKESS